MICMKYNDILLTKSFSALTVLLDTKYLIATLWGDACGLWNNSGGEKRKMEKTGSKTAGDRLISLLLALNAEDAGGAEISRRQNGHLILTKRNRRTLTLYEMFPYSNISVLNIFFFNKKWIDIIFLDCHISQKR